MGPWLRVECQGHMYKGTFPSLMLKCLWGRASKQNRFLLGLQAMNISAINVNFLKTRIPHNSLVSSSCYQAGLIQLLITHRTTLTIPYSLLESAQYHHYTVCRASAMFCVAVHNARHFKSTYLSVMHVISCLRTYP